jgi:hypothetical protein
VHHGDLFVIGDKLADPGGAALMCDAHAAGHWIGNHTLTHSRALGEATDAATAAREIGETQAPIGACAHPDKLFRPYGKSGVIGPHLLDRAAVSLLLSERYCCVIWNSVPRDWCDLAGWVERCIADVRANDGQLRCCTMLKRAIARMSDSEIRGRLECLAPTSIWTKA